jgi:hypothetical protein
MKTRVQTEGACAIRGFFFFKSAVIRLFIHILNIAHENSIEKLCFETISHLLNNVCFLY